MSVAVSTVGPLTVWCDGEEGGEEKVVAEFGESEGEKEEGEKDDVTNCFGSPVCFWDANTAFSC